MNVFITEEYSGQSDVPVVSDDNLRVGLLMEMKSVIVTWRLGRIV